MVHDSINAAVITAVPRGVRSLLDVGCGRGSLGATVKERDGCEVVGVTCDAEEAAIAAGRLDRVITVDLNDYVLEKAGRFDCVLFSHVLEHLHHPCEVLKGARKCLTATGTVVVALPNALYWRQRLQFLRGRFRYADEGIMDRTHYRFFDWTTAQALIQEAGFRLESAAADGGFPGSRFVPLLRRPLDRYALRLRPGLFGWQFVLRARL